MFDSRQTAPNPSRGDFTIRLDNISVRYRVPHERFATLKEHAIRWLERRVRYDDFWALKDASLQACPGEVIGIIGRNGAGKSTLLKVIARVLKPSQGRIQIRGRVAPLLEFGAGFHPELTGRENVFLNGAILGFTHSEMRAKFQRIVDFAELWDFIDAPLRTYSSGMTARLGFAVATDVDPNILLIDEILGVGDPEFQRKSVDRINEFHKHGVTILFVSHDLNAVRNLCTQCIWLDRGQVAASGPTGDVINAYLTRMAENEEKRLSNREGREQTTDRWGSGEVTIKNVSFLDAAGHERHVFSCGEMMRARIRYHATQRIQNPIFGVGIYRSDGVHVNGPNTRFSDFPIDQIEGEGEIDYIIESLPLLEGTFEFSATVYDSDILQAFDHRHRTFRFAVQRGDVQECYGLVHIKSRWEHRKL